METASTDRVDALAVQLLVHGSRFARSLSRRTGEVRSLVAMRVLSNLHQAGPLRIGDLADRELITQPAMTTTVNRLEAEGLVVREEDETDRRASVVRITGDGEAALVSFRDRAAGVARGALTQLGEEDLAVLERAGELLEQLVVMTESSQSTR